MANGNNYNDMTERNDQTSLSPEQENVGLMQDANRYTIQNTNSSQRVNPPTPDPQDQDTFAEILAANEGAYVLIQFLIGSTSLVDKEGYLYAVGMNFVTIYEPLDDRYVVCDLYSVKFVTIYNTPPINTSQRPNSSGYQNNTNRYQRSRRAY